MTIPVLHVVFLKRLASAVSLTRPILCCSTTRVSKNVHPATLVIQTSNVRFAVLSAKLAIVLQQTVRLAVSPQTSSISKAANACQSVQMESLLTKTQALVLTVTKIALVVLVLTCARAARQG